MVRTVIEGANIAYDLLEGAKKAAKAGLSDKSVSDSDGRNISEYYAPNSKVKELQDEIENVAKTGGLGELVYSDVASLPFAVAKAYADASMAKGVCAIAVLQDYGTCYIYCSEDKLSYIAICTSGYVKYAEIGAPYRAVDVTVYDRYVQFDDNDYLALKNEISSTQITVDYD